jgi:RES domain-containing protein
MLVWRICRERFAADIGAGEGASLFGGRWNSRGVRVVYASTSLSLAAMEYFVHLEPNFQPDDLVSISGEIPAEIRIDTFDVRRLPAHWHEASDESLRHFGDDWLRAAASVAILVPSAVVRTEWNVLVNPGHSDYSRITWRKPEPFTYDVRMFK